MDKPSFKLEVFEGPLDLLLKLISKNKINIYDIPIAEVLEQYLESIEGLQTVDMDIASEFISMAAYLIYIKSQMLLPLHEEEEDDPRENLVKMLLEYKRYKEAAICLNDMLTAAPTHAVRAPMLYETKDEAYSQQHTLIELALSYATLFKKIKRRLPPPISSFSGIVSTVYTPISTRVVYILRRLLKNDTLPLWEAFNESSCKSDVIATFLALLELISNSRILIIGSDKNVCLTLRKD